jgi:hypothetical protein
MPELVEKALCGKLFSRTVNEIVTLRQQVLANTYAEIWD